jgi:hypothetical protein
MVDCEHACMDDRRKGEEEKFSNYQKVYYTCGTVKSMFNIKNGTTNSSSSRLS